MRNKPKIIRDKLKDKVVRIKLKDQIIRDIWTHFQTEEEKKGRKELEKKKEHNERLIKDGIVNNIRRLFDQDEDYYVPKSVNNFWNNNYIEYESNGDKNRNLSFDEYINKIETYLRNTIINLQNSNTWKNHIISLKDGEERVMHSNSDKIEFTSHDDANEVVKLF